MKTGIILAFQTADGLKLYREINFGKLGRFIVKNKQELLSIIGAIMIDQASCDKKSREWGNLLYNQLEKNNIILADEKQVVTLKGVLC